MMIYEPATDLWTWSLATSKRDQSVTVLDSGKVLLAGGYDDRSTGQAVFNGSSEYDPAADTSTWSGNLLTPRTGHTATLLHSGQVLITGGTSDISTTASLASAELYDPSTRTWTAAGTMSRPRAHHRALRLYTGSVLVLSDPASSTDTSVDVYDPYNARWFAGPALPFTQPASATLLYSGEVLVTNNAGQAALYSPSQNAWLPVASLQPTTRAVPTGVPRRSASVPPTRRC